MNNMKLNQVNSMIYIILLMTLGSSFYGVDQVVDEMGMIEGDGWNHEMRMNEVLKNGERDGIWVIYYKSG
jgi:hypothetical protein